jgi:hypothetical protein
LTATVDCGDGTAPVVCNAGKFLYPSGLNSVIVPGHSFQKAGDLTVHVSVTDQHGGVVAWNDPFSVTPVTVALIKNTPVGAKDDVVGGEFSYMPEVVGGPDAGIIRVDWTFNNATGGPGAMRLQNGATTPLDTNGFHTETYQTDWQQPAFVQHAITYDGHWDGTPGAHTVIAKITWRDSNGGWHWDYTFSTANVQSPNIPMTAQLGVANVRKLSDDQGGVWYLGAGNKYGTPGIAVTATPDAAAGAMGGTYGIVQTITSFDSRLYGVKESQKTPGVLYIGDHRSFVKRDSAGKWSMSAPFLDNIPNTKSPIYYPPTPASNANEDGTKTVGTGPISIEDSPNSEFRPVLNRITRMQRNDAFLDMLIYTPLGGLPVSLSTLAWAWSGSAIPDMAAKGWALEEGWVDPKVTSQSQPGDVIQNPAWADQAANYINPDGTVNFYLLSWIPITDATLDPDPGLAMTDPITEVVMAASQSQKRGHHDPQLTRLSHSAFDPSDHPSRPASRTNRLFASGGSGELGGIPIRHAHRTLLSQLPIADEKGRAKLPLLQLRDA